MITRVQIIIFSYEVIEVFKDLMVIIKEKLLNKQSKKNKRMVKIFLDLTLENNNDCGKIIILKDRFIHDNFIVVITLVFKGNQINMIRKLFV